MENLLNNNANSMKTQVETYLIEETAELIYDNEQLDRWNEHVKALGLTGQLKLAAPEKSPIPFMHMKEGVCNIFSTLCPRRVDITKYDKTPIPVEILELAALAKREQYFDCIEIWFDDKDPDPACVGILAPNFYVLKPGGAYLEYTPYPKSEAEEKAKEIEGSIKPADFGQTKYLIGRWADVKRPIEELKAMAKARYIEEDGASIRGKIKELQRELDDLELTAVKRFN